MWVTKILQNLTAFFVVVCLLCFVFVPFFLVHTHLVKVLHILSHSHFQLIAKWFRGFIATQLDVVKHLPVGRQESIYFLFDKIGLGSKLRDFRAFEMMFSLHNSITKPVEKI